MPLLRSATVIVLVTLIACTGTATLTIAAQRATAVTPRRPARTAAMPDDSPKTCPTTRPPARAFVPPLPYPAKPPGPGKFWFSTENLWTMLRADGTWRGLPHYRPTDSAYRQKLFWWRQGYDWRADPYPQLTVRGRRLDVPAPPLVASRSTNGYRAEDLKSFMVVGVDIATLGCWEITGHFQHHELTFVVWVAP